MLWWQRRLGTNYRCRVQVQPQSIFDLISVSCKCSFMPLYTQKNKEIYCKLLLIWLQEFRWFTCWTLMLRRALTSYPGNNVSKFPKKTGLAFPLRICHMKHKHEGINSKSHEVPWLYKLGAKVLKFNIHCPFSSDFCPHTHSWGKYLALELQH